MRRRSPDAEVWRTVPSVPEIEASSWGRIRRKSHTKAMPWWRSVLRLRTDLRRVWQGEQERNHGSHDLRPATLAQPLRRDPFVRFVLAALKRLLSAPVRCCPRTFGANTPSLVRMNHIALCHRNSARGWLIMSTDGRPWVAERVADAPLATMLQEALALLAQCPGADFTCSTRTAGEVKASPFARPADLAHIVALERSSISVMVPMGAGQWRLLHREPHQTFSYLDAYEAADVINFLRNGPQDAEAIDSGLAGPVEVWLRRSWDAKSVVDPPKIVSGNVTPLRRRPLPQRLQPLSDRGSHG